MNRQATILAGIATVAIACGGAGGAPLDDAETIVVVKAGRIITGAGDEIERGEIVIRDGKVDLVGRNLEYPKNAIIIDAPNETVIPGMLAPHATVDGPDYGLSGVHGDYRPIDRMYSGEFDFTPYLESGCTAAAFYLPGSGITCVSSLLRTAGEEEQRTIDDSLYLRVSMSSMPRDKTTLRDGLTKAQAEIDKVEKARKEWEEKQKKAAEEAKQKGGEKREDDNDGGDQPEKDGEKEGRGDQPPPPTPTPEPEGEGEGEGGDEKKPDEAKDANKKDEPEKFVPPPIDPAHQPLVDLIQKKEGEWALIEVGSASDLVHANDLLDDQEKIAHRIFLNPGWNADLHYAVDALAENEATSFVLTRPRLNELPNTATRYNLAAALTAHGCEVALTPAGDDSKPELVSARLADLVRAGMTRRDAIRAVTLNPWKFIGMDDRFGSIEKGKAADLVFLDGDLLDPMTKVTRVMILGDIAWEAEEAP